MSRQIRGSFPHPVLDAGDDVASIFEVFNVSYTPSVEDVAVRFQIRMNDPDLIALIAEGRARFSVRWSCSATVSSGEETPFQEHVYADSVGYSVWLDQRSIRGKVRLELRLVSQVAIPAYQLERQHSDYGNARFYIEIGDILGLAGTVDIYPEKLFDPLNPPVGSCFHFEKDPSLKRGMRVHFDDDDYVVVRFSESAFAGLQTLGHRPELQVSLVVMPALMETLAFMAGHADSPDAEDLSDKAWFQSINTLLTRSGASLEDRPLATAQKLLEFPTDKTLTLAAEGVDTDDD